MRTNLLFAALLLSGAAFAQSSTAPVILKAPSDYYVNSVSANGKWACGEYSLGEDNYYAFRWNLETGEIEMLSSNDISEASAVTNDGVVVGNYVDRTYYDNGASFRAAGYWKDGSWHRLEIPEGTVQSSDALSVTPDGDFICGQVVTSPIDCVGYIWKDGKIYKKLSTEKSRINHPAAVTPDGQIAVGYIQDGGRRGCIWEADGTITTLTDGQFGGALANKISFDGKKMLYEGEHVIVDGRVGRYAIRDLATRKDDVVFPAGTKAGDLSFLALSDKGTVMGVDGSRGYIYQNGTAYYADDYLMAHGVDLAAEHVFMMPETDYYQVYQAMAISSDDNVMAFRYYNDNKNDAGEYSVAVQSMVVKFNQPATGLSPADVSAVQAKGTSSVLVSWKDNVAAKNVTGYNVYRNTAKVNSELITDKYFVDTNLADGDYTYTVTAVYGNTESPVSDAATVTVNAAVSTPNSVYSMQYGYNSANIGWDIPQPNLGSLTYNDENAKVETFGLKKKGVSYETAVMFDQAQLKAYQGQKIAAVVFNPLSAQGGWKINLYTYDDNDALKLIYSQPVTQELNYGKRNVVKLDVPQDIPAGKLVVATEVAVTESNKAINAMISENSKNGYTDLLRKTTEADFYSFGDYMMAYGAFQQATWTTDVVFAPEGTDIDKADVDHYNVYADGSLLGTTKDLKYLAENMPVGKHNFGVSAVFGDGRESAQSATVLDIAANDKILKGVDNISVLSMSKTAVKAVWAAPTDKDNTTLQYCSGDAVQDGPAATSAYNYAFMAGTKYSHDMFKGRSGYVIRSIRFYPTSDATFTAYIFKYGEVVNETEIYDYKKNQWNEVELSEPVVIEDNAEYTLGIDCYDVTPETAPLALDVNKAKSGYSDLVSFDGGSSWISLLSASYASWNWMMGFNIEAPEGIALPVDGYDVKIDGEKKADKIKATEFEYDFGAEDSKEHTVQVDVYYTVKPESVSGGITRFVLGVNGIGENVVGKLAITKDNNELTVTGDNVKSVEIVSASGAVVAKTNGNTVSLNGLTGGVYIVKAVAGGKTVTRKIVIEK